MAEAFELRSRLGDRASVQAATRVNAEQASHDEGLVKGSPYGDIENVSSRRTAR
jgi:hypothetical protein